MSTVDLIESIFTQEQLSPQEKRTFIAHYLNLAASEMATGYSNPALYESLENKFLHIAVNLKLVQVVKFLLDCGCSPDVTRDYRQTRGLECAGTPLSDAASDGQIEIIDLLIQYGADPEITDARGWTPLHQAIAANQLATAQHLLVNHKVNVFAKLGADCNVVHLPKTKETAEFILGYLERTNQLDALINDCDYFGTTPFCDAIYSGHEEVALVFLNKYADKVDIHKADDRGNTPLHYAVQLGSELIVNKLLSLGARNTPNKENATPLDWAGVKYQSQPNNPIYTALYLSKHKTQGIAYESPLSTKTNCVRHYVRTKEIATFNDVGQGNFIQKTHVQFVHATKDNTVKFKFSLNESQHDLRNTLDQLPAGRGNSIVANLSFEVLITNLDGSLFRDVITFPLKIPNSLPTNSIATRLPESSHNISFSYVNDAYSWHALGELYRQGRSVVGGHAHGHVPDYSGNTRGHEQYIYHTEQMLAAYLCKPEASTMIVNRLIAEIRGKYPTIAYGSTIKIYNAILSFHSDKTPCAPCEYVMIGLQNAYSIVTPYFAGFTRLVEQELERKTIDHTNHQPGCYFKFNYPKRNKNNASNAETIQVFTLYTADNNDADHQTSYVPTQPLPHDDESTIISTKPPMINRNIFLTNFGKQLDRASLIPADADISQRSILVSGSVSSAHNRNKANHTARVIEDELDNTTAGISFLLK